MTDALFQNILQHLHLIDYRRAVHINRYNEPLADRDYALRRIREIRTALPDAPIVVFTNGDYLDAAYVHELYSLGILTDVDNLFVAWTSARYVQWRKDLFSYEVKKKPCTTCMYGAMVHEIPEMPWIVAQWRRTLQMDAAPSPVPALA